MFDAGTTSTVVAPCSIAQDPSASKPWRHELVDAAVPAICEHAFVSPVQRLDLRAAIVNRIVAIAGSWAGNPDDIQIAANQQLEVT